MKSIYKNFGKQDSFILKSIFGSFLLVFIRFFSTNYFYKIGSKVIKKKARIKRFGSVLFKFIYFVIISTTEYTLIKNESWLPVELGGSGNIINAFINWPLHEITFYHRLIYIINLSYHTHSLIYLFLIGLKRNDRNEMLIHHLVTIFIILLSWYAKFIYIGIVVMFLHNISDISTYAIKVLIDTDCNNLTIILFIAVLLTWGWTRLYVLPNIIRQIYINVPSLIGRSNTNIFIVLLGTLFCLHIYWYGLVLNMGYVKLKKNIIEDTYQRDENEVT